jgi:hypothetical protein
MMQASNVRANQFQMAVGPFLQSCQAPEAVQELLARLGVSVSPSSINDIVSSLSAQADKAMQSLGETFLTTYAYDNLYIDLKASVPTVRVSPSCTPVGSERTPAVGT